MSLSVVQMLEAPLLPVSSSPEFSPSFQAQETLNPFLLAREVWLVIEEVQKISRVHVCAAKSASSTVD